MAGPKRCIAKMDLNYQYTLSDFLADLMTVESLKSEDSSGTPFDLLVAGYFGKVHGEGDYGCWRYEKFLVVTSYVSKNMAAFNVGDLAAVGEEKALTRGKLFRPILQYAVTNNVTNPSEFPEPKLFHPNAG